MRYIFFVNPTAGRGRAQEKIKQSINDYFAANGGEYKIYENIFAIDTKKAARKEAETGDLITMFACGGEGTVYEVLNGIVGFDNVSLGVIPCGSANDFLKQFESADCFSDIAAQISGERVKVDLINAGGLYCLNGCSVGMDAVVASNMFRFKRLPFVTGKMAYSLAIFKTFLGKLGIEMNLSVDGKPAQSVSCLFAVIANAPYYGGGYMAAPKAVPNDGRLNFTLVDLISKTKILKFLPVYKNGKHEGLDCCTTKECTCMEFTAEKEIPVNLDGEIIYTKEMRFEIVNEGLSFVVPKGAEMKMLTKV